MLGRATFMTVLSSPMITSESDRTARIFQRFRWAVASGMAILPVEKTNARSLYCNDRSLSRLESRSHAEGHAGARRRPSAPDPLGGAALFRPRRLSPHDHAGHLQRGGAQPRRGLQLLHGKGRAN